jgi:hypothetical protein
MHGQQNIKEDTITKITKTTSLGKIEIIQIVPNTDPEDGFSGRIHPILFG